ncbi:TPA: hypothetical protein ACNU17_003058 [Aeromonas salmonicida subsp. pectinolytica]
MDHLPELLTARSGVLLISHGNLIMSNNIQGATATYFNNLCFNDYKNNYKQNCAVLRITPNPVDSDFSDPSDPNIHYIRFNCVTASGRRNGQEIPFVKYLNTIGITDSAFKYFRASLTKVVPNHLDCYYGFVNDGSWIHFGLLDATDLDGSGSGRAYIISLNTFTKKQTFQVFDRDLRLNQDGEFKGKLVKATINRTAMSHSDLRSRTVSLANEATDLEIEVQRLSALLEQQSKQIEALNDTVHSQQLQAERQQRQIDEVTKTNNDIMGVFVTLEKVIGSLQIDDTKLATKLTSQLSDLIRVPEQPKVVSKPSTSKAVNPVESFAAVLEYAAKPLFDNLLSRIDPDGLYQYKEETELLKDMDEQQLNKVQFWMSSNNQKAVVEEAKRLGVIDYLRGCIVC